ncbi:hypothetical protein SAMN06265365_12326 [Tistlia consotensis]|uniref:Uncharacterized protein n=1 Tax=Tistlia consotensis USBA 355 TaxID=560819 RepID=A0A1Y6CHM7_9PROT|nr:hypothetical protein [Tistlia consotensis]SMF64703.1 hypothetical protein SAMN05428998_12583 [Tistlia consotensis USBA 355]SNR96908.1 hypothetical protein SAMN06265365_12326 [Tistlia consotensis]
MPRVPTAQAAGLGRQAIAPVSIPVQSFSLPAIRVPRDERGAALSARGEALSGLGGALGGIADDLAKRQAAERGRALLQEAETASAAAVEDLLKNPESGYLAKAGRGALLARDETLRSLDAVGRRGLAELEPALRPAYAGL